MKSSPLAPLMIAGLLAVAAVAFWLLGGSSAPPLVEAIQPKAEATVSPPAAFPPGVAVAMAAPPNPPDLPPPKRAVVHSPEAMKEMDDVQFMLRDFRARLGGNPGGTNAEIMRAVMGGNPARAKFGPPEGQSVSDSGELLDHWGVPYFFHQLSAEEMEIRSAGPDRTMYTPDDILMK